MQFWQGFSWFHIAFVIKRSLYIKFRVFRKEKMQKRPREATAHFQVWVATEVFSVVIDLFGSVSRHGSLYRDMVPRL